MNEQKRLPGTPFCFILKVLFFFFKLALRIHWGKKSIIKNISKKNLKITINSPPKIAASTWGLPIYTVLSIHYSIICFLNLTMCQKHCSTPIWTHFNVVSGAHSLCASPMSDRMPGALTQSDLSPSWLSHLWMAVPIPATFRASLCLHIPRLISVMPRL